MPDYSAGAQFYSHRQGHKWYALLSPAAMDDQLLEDGLSVNTAVVRLPVEDLTTFSENLRVGYLPGNTLLVDFPFPAIADSIAHWAEIMLPTYSVLKSGGWQRSAVGKSRHIDRVLFANMRKYTNDWFQQVGPGRTLCYQVGCQIRTCRPGISGVIFALCNGESGARHILQRCCAA